jgi:hypothetical protein
MFLRVLIGVLLLLHGLIHGVLAVAPNPGTSQPVAATFFSGWAGPWLTGRFSADTLKSIALVLAAIAAVGFLLAGWAMFDKLVPHDWWRTLALASSVISLMLCLLFWDRYLIAGPVVAIGIIVALGVIRWPTEALLGY